MLNQASLTCICVSKSSSSCGRVCLGSVAHVCFVAQSVTVSITADMNHESPTDITRYTQLTWLNAESTTMHKERSVSVALAWQTPITPQTGRLPQFHESQCSLTFGKYVWQDSLTMFSANHTHA